MGWLRDLMLSSGGGLRSFGALSRTLLADSDWPAELALRERSLAAVLSKLDRDLELEWLQDRPAVQAVLAKVLKCSVVEIATRSRRPAIATPERQVRWRDLRFARSLDLAEEALPPGLPAALADPVSWGASLWVAPSGAGKSLAGAWLRARGLARFVRLASGAELDSVLASNLPLFVELESGAELVPDAPPRDRLCVAVTTPPRRASGWNYLRSPALDLEAIVTWVAARLPADTSFDPEAALEWLASAALGEGWIDGLGTALGLCGALDELGMREARGADVFELARRFLRRRFDETFGPGANDTAWLRRNALDVLTGMARRAATDDVLPASARRTLDEWMALVPEQHKTGLEVEWLRVSLARVGSSIRPAEIERAARRLSPGAYRIVHAFRSAGVLGASEDDRLAISPHWIGRVAEVRALRELLDGSPFEWGEAMLRPHAAGTLTGHLLARVARGDTTALSDVLELEASDNPAHAAALETTFRAVGLAILRGVEVDTDLLHDLWRETLDACFRGPDGLPLPRIEHPGTTEPALERGAFHLAALAVSEALGDELAPGPLAPWTASEAPSWLWSAYDSISRLVESCAALSAPAHALVDRLRASVGLARGDSLHELERPGIVLDEIDAGVLGASSFRSLGVAQGPVLIALGLARGRPGVAAIARALWLAWAQCEGAPLTGSVLDPDGAAAEELWAELPVELSYAALHAADPARAARRLSAMHWHALAGASLTGEVARAAAAHVPEAELSARLSVESDRTNLAQLWRRFPDSVARALIDLGERALAVASAAPPEHTEASVAALARLEPRAWPREERARAAAWLHGLVAERAPGYRAAFALFETLRA